MHREKKKEGVQLIVPTLPMARLAYHRLFVHRWVVRIDHRLLNKVRGGTIHVSMFLLGAILWDDKPFAR